MKCNECLLWLHFIFYAAETCQQSWADLRYEYQRHVRRLRQFLRKNNQNRKRRPVFALESEMLFLWRFIKDM